MCSFGAFGARPDDFGRIGQDDPAIAGTSESGERDVSTGSEQPRIDHGELRIRLGVFEDHVDDLSDRLVSQIHHDAADETAV